MNLDILQLESFVVGDNRPWLENQTNEVVFRSKLANIIEADMCLIHLFIISIFKDL